MSTLTANNPLPRTVSLPTRVPWSIAPAWKVIAQRLLLLCGFMLLVAAKGTPYWPQIGAVLLLTSLLPQYRKQILCGAALVWIYFAPPLDWEPLRKAATVHGANAWLKAWPLSVAMVWAFGAGYVMLVRRYPKSLIGQRPVMGLVVIAFAWIALAVHTPVRGAAWFFAATSASAFANYVWFFAYWVIESKARTTKKIALQTGYMRPFYGTLPTPFGKGSAYMDRVEAKSDEQLAACQRRGLQLMLWSFAIGAVWLVYVRVIFGSNGGVLHHFFPSAGVGLVPSIADALKHQMEGNPYPWHIRWLVLVCQFVMNVLHVLVFGHQAIATCRMAGFDALPNTDRPFAATSIADFYNRIAYYYKELLATFFFFPTFLRYFKGFPRFRVFAATFAAAGFGNFVYHLMYRADDIFEIGLWRAIVEYRVYALYCIVLGAAIGISQMRLMRRRGPLPAYRRLLATMVVLLFYTLITAFDDPIRGRSITMCVKYVASLFWLS